jgi:hypothetical protein
MNNTENTSTKESGSGQIRLCYMGAFLGRDEAEVYRDEFFQMYGEDVKEGFLVVIQDDLVQINNHWVVRIMAENAQQELELE